MGKKYSGGDDESKYRVTSARQRLDELLRRTEDPNSDVVGEMMDGMQTDVARAQLPRRVKRIKEAVGEETVASLQRLCAEQDPPKDLEKILSDFTRRVRTWPDDPAEQEACLTAIRSMITESERELGNFQLRAGAVEPRLRLEGSDDDDKPPPDRGGGGRVA